MLKATKGYDYSVPFLGDVSTLSLVGSKRYEDGSVTESKTSERYRDTAVPQSRTIESNSIAV